MLRRVSVMVLAGLLVAAPGLARACAVCTAGRDEENQLAFLLSTIGMSLMPLVAIGTLVFVIWRRIKKLEAETSSAAPASSDGTRPVVPRTTPRTMPGTMPGTGPRTVPRAAPGA